MSWLERMARSRTFWLVVDTALLVGGIVSLGSAIFWWEREPAHIAYFSAGIGVLQIFTAIWGYRQIHRITGTSTAQD